MKKIVPVKVWVTTLALTEGIFEAGSEIGWDGKFRLCKSPSGKQVALFQNGHGWAESKNAAIKKAKAMVRKELAALEVKICALEAMKFD